MSAWEFIGITEKEYDNKFFNKHPIPFKCAYPSCHKKHADGKHFCLEHFKQLQEYISNSVEAKQKIEGKLE
jgi:hypothetical protein